MVRPAAGCIDQVPGVAVTGGVTIVGVMLVDAHISTLAGMVKLVLGIHELASITGVHCAPPIARVAAGQLPEQPSPLTVNVILPILVRALTGSVSEKLKIPGCVVEPGKPQLLQGLPSNAAPGPHEVPLNPS
jgi:hypothetical protein